MVINGIATEAQSYHLLQIHYAIEDSFSPSRRQLQCRVVCDVRICKAICALVQVQSYTTTTG